MRRKRRQLLNVGRIVFLRPLVLNLKSDRRVGHPAVTWWNFYFRLLPGAIRRPQIIEFLSHLMRHVPGRLLIVWTRKPVTDGTFSSHLTCSTMGNVPSVP